MSKWIHDAGHGGNDPGASYGGLQEKDLTLEAVLYVRDRLEEHGIRTALTRTTDKTINPTSRADMVKKYDRCISHHFNAGGGNGVECIHSIYSDGKFERILIDKFRKNGYPVRPRPIYAKKNSRGQDWYYMHRLTGSCRVTILEYDFLDGPNHNKLKDKKYREGLYECVVEAICEYEGIKYKKKVEKSKQANGGLYKVQVGAFSKRENAERLVKELKSKGYDAIIKVE